MLPPQDASKAPTSLQLSAHWTVRAPFLSWKEDQHTGQRLSRTQAYSSVWQGKAPCHIPDLWLTDIKAAMLKEREPLPALVKVVP